MAEGRASVEPGASGSRGSLAGTSFLHHGPAHPASAGALRRHTTSNTEENNARATLRHNRRNNYEALTEEQIAECRDLFQMFDKNSDGMIDRDEFVPMMRTLGIHLSDLELDAFFHKMDVSHDGLVTFKELLLFLQSIAKPFTKEEELTEAFNYFNPQFTEESTYAPVITKKGLAKVMIALREDISEEECADMIRAATENLDVIDFDLFQELCKPVRKPSRARFDGTSSSLLF